MSEQSPFRAAAEEAKQNALDRIEEEKRWKIYTFQLWLIFTQILLKFIYSNNFSLL